MASLIAEIGKFSYKECQRIFDALQIRMSALEDIDGAEFDPDAVYVHAAGDFVYLRDGRIGNAGDPVLACLTG